MYVIAIMSFAVSGTDDGWQFFAVTIVLPLQGFFNMLIYLFPKFKAVNSTMRSRLNGKIPVNWNDQTITCSLNPRPLSHTQHFTRLMWAP